MTNGFAALKVCAHTVEQLQKMGIKKADAGTGAGYPGAVCRT